MLQVIRHVAEESCYALKGGTAINFFVRDMPRLSIDIDLTYVPVEGRDVSVRRMSDVLRRIAASVQRR
jgi:hypothetical protein